MLSSLMHQFWLLVSYKIKFFYRINCQIFNFLTQKQSYEIKYSIEAFLHSASIPKFSEYIIAYCTGNLKKLSKKALIKTRYVLMN